MFRAGDGLRGAEPHHHGGAQPALLPRGRAHQPRGHHPRLPREFGYQQVILFRYYDTYVQATFEKLEDKVIRFIKNIGSGRPSYEDMESGRLLGGDP